MSDAIFVSEMVLDLMLGREGRGEGAPKGPKYGLIKGLFGLPPPPLPTPPPPMRMACPLVRRQRLSCGKPCKISSRRRRQVSAVRGGPMALVSTF